jgi:hypothetical protein
MLVKGVFLLVSGEGNKLKDMEMGNPEDGGKSTRKQHGWFLRSKSGTARVRVLAAARRRKTLGRSSLVW